MGRIKTQLTKRVAKKLLEQNPERFKTTFEENKKLVGESAEILSHKLRNIIAGYVTRLVKARKQ
jgi:small subunit ribosomal protein S17e